MSLQDLKSKRRWTDSPLENVIYRTVRYDIADPAGIRSDWRRDRIVGLLMRDACGLKAEFDRDGKPCTTVTIMLRDPSERHGGVRRHEVLDIAHGKDQAKPMGPGSLCRAEGCYLKDGVIQARWIARMYPELDRDLHAPLIGYMASVRPQVRREGEDGLRYFQNRYVLAVAGASVFSGLDDFKLRAARCLDSVADWPGIPGCVVRGVDLRTRDAVSTEFFRGWDTESRQPLPATDALSSFLTAPENREWVENIREADPGVLWEVVPTIRIGTGAYSLPQSKLEAARATGRRIGDTELYRYDDSTAYRFVGDEGVEYGYTVSDLEIERRRTDDGFTSWYCTGTRPTLSSPILYPQSEVVTANLPREIAEDFTARASSRSPWLHHRRASAA